MGEQFSFPTEIVGVALNLRKTGARLAIWTRGEQGESSLKTIGREFKALVGLPGSKEAGYSSHADSKKKSSGKFLWSNFKGDMTV